MNPNREDASPSKTFRVYLVWAFGLLSILYLAPLLLLKVPGLEQWGGSSFGPALDYGFQLQHQNADVVIFGDSSAVVGIDPRQISSELGLKVLNLPNTGASLHVVADMNLRQYLRTNKHPRLIVFYFTPWNLDYSHEVVSNRVYEGEEMLARHGSLGEIAAFAKANPVDSLQFPFRFWSANTPSAMRNALRKRHPAQDVAAAGGHADPLASRPSLNAPCHFPDDLMRERPDTTARELIQRYRQAGTEVLFYLAPLPTCDNLNLLTTRRYTDLPIAPPRALPVADYKQDFAFAHLRPSAVPQASHDLSVAIRAQLQSY